MERSFIAAELTSQVIKAITNATIHRRPPNRRTETSPNTQRAPLGVRQAVDSDTSRIVSWLGSKDADSDTEFHWLGGKRSALLQNVKDDEIRKWINSRYGAFILFARPSEGVTSSSQRAYSLKSETPIAFLNIAEFPPDSADLVPHLEVGRLLVNPKFRHQGFGSTFLRHVSGVLAEHEDTIAASINARVLEGNEIARIMVEKLPFDSQPEPNWAHSGSDGCRWYRYRLVRREGRFGVEVAHLRRKRDLSQAAVAFQCGIATAMMNMIESGKRAPSLDTLQKLFFVLATDEFEQIKLLLSLIGIEPDPSLEGRLGTKSLGQEAEDRDVHLWIFTDQIAEVLDDKFFESSVKDIQAGFDRWYFVPEGYWERDGHRFIQRLKKSIGGEQTIQDRVRFFQAPGPLCALRLRIENPPKDIGQSGLVPSSITIGRGQTARLPLEKSQSGEFMVNILRVVRAIESSSQLGQEGLEGFKRLYGRSV